MIRIKSGSESIILETEKMQQARFSLSVNQVSNNNFSFYCTLNGHLYNDLANFIKNNLDNENIEVERVLNEESLTKLTNGRFFSLNEDVKNNLVTFEIFGTFLM